MSQMIRRVATAFFMACVVGLILLFPGSARAAVSYSAAEIAVVDLINNYRVANGVAPLLVSDLVSDASSKHSQDMAKYGFFSHSSVKSDWFPSGSNAGSRMVACGYPPNAHWGENIAMGYTTPESVFAAWRASPTHDENMLNRHWAVIGVAYEAGPGGGYWTTDFGSYLDGTAHPSGGSAPPDTVAPTVAILSPGAGADLRGLVTVTISATDNIEVERVELWIGSLLIATDYEKPYAIVWNTSAFNPGTYLMEVRAYDSAGNAGEDQRVIHVSHTPGTSSSTTTTSTTTPTTRPTTSTTTPTTTIPSTTTTTTPAPTTTTTTPTTTTTTTTTTTITTTTTTPSSTTSTTAPPTTTTTAKPAVSFNDVPSSHRFFHAIASLAACDVVCGFPDGLFRPDSAVTRGQFAKIIMLALGRHTPAIDNEHNPSFVDVRYDGSPYPFDFVEEAAALHIITGFNDGTFGPAKNVTRLQLVQMLVRAGGKALAQPPAGYACFEDVPAYAKDAVMIARFNGLASGKTATCFDPYSAATRGQVAQMVFQLLRVTQETQ